MAGDTLAFLKQQLADVEAQIQPLNKLRATLVQQIEDIEDAETLAAHGLKRGEALAFTRECMDVHTWMSEGEKVNAPATLYIAGVDDRRGYVVLSVYRDGGGLAFCADYDMAQRMKAAHTAGA